MPCNSDYLEPTVREREHQRAANLLVYSLTEMGCKVPNWIKHEAGNIYAGDSRLLPMLCELVSGMSCADRERVVYNARDGRSRDLANWWERHLEADRQRIRDEQLKAERDSLKASGLAKLTRAERRALGLS